MDAKRPGTPPIFSAGELVAGRYRIIRFIARGGMGEIYKAEDLELREFIALKTIRPEIASDERSLARFKREIHLARKVTHPNVCRVFDVAHHRLVAPGADGEETVIFLTMELLFGETLANRLLRTGPLSLEEARPLIRQMAAGLEAAHRAGVVHRDLKPDNVVLMPPRDPGSELRVVVTDFGLACGSGASDSFAASVSQTGDIIGSPAYMAPEQVEGAEVNAAADLYALGVVMFEMATGALPFGSSCSLGTAIKRLKEPAPSPRTLAADLDPRWEAAIVRCLERRPEDRFASAHDVESFIGGDPVPAPRRRRRTLGWVAAAAATATATALIGIGAHHRLRPRPQPAAAPVAEVPPMPRKPRRSVAVLGFHNVSRRPETAWLSTALSEVLSLELAAGEKLRTIPGEAIARTKIDLSLAEANSLAGESLTRIRTALGTDMVVIGSYFDLGERGGGKIRLDLRLQDAVAGHTVASITDTGTEADLLELVARVGARLRDQLGVGELSPAEARTVRTALPASPAAARLYAEGLGKLRLFDLLGARQLLEKAVQTDPNHAFAHFALAEVWSALGYDTRAKDEAKRAFDLATNLSREERLSIEARYREVNKEREKVIEICRALWTFFPDNQQYGLRLAQAQALAHHGKDALATVELLRRRLPPGVQDPHIELTEAAAAGALSDYRRRRAAAERAAAIGLEQGARLVVAHARLVEASALHFLGENDRATGRFADARRIFADAGDRSGVARAVDGLAGVELDRGHTAEAKATFEEALALWREVGHQDGVAIELVHVGMVYAQQGNLAMAMKYWQQSLTTYREIGDQDKVMRSLHNIAVLYNKQGDFESAKRMYYECLKLAEQLGDQDGTGVVKFNLGNILYGQGELAKAKALYLEALALVRKIGVKSETAYALDGLGVLALEDGDFDGARQRHQEALAIRKQMGEKLNIGNSYRFLSNLALEEHRDAEAVALARSAVESFERTKHSDFEALSRSSLAAALLEQGKLDEAEAEVKQATALARRGQAKDVPLEVAIAAAQVRAARGWGREATRSLGATLLMARQAGKVNVELRARLALGEIELTQDRSSGRSRLEQLASDAGARGYRLLAAKATARLRGGLAKADLNTSPAR